MIIWLLQIISLTLWVGLAFYLTKPAFRSFKHTQKSLDPLWAAAWLLAVNRCVFIITNLFLHRAPVALSFCHALSVAAGIYYAATIRHYRKHDA